MLDTMQEAHAYLTKLQKACRRTLENAMQQETDQAAKERETAHEVVLTLNLAIRVEYDECRGALREVTALLHALREWNGGGQVIENEEEDEDDLMDDSSNEYSTDGEGDYLMGP
jgi:hypothetical protein